MFSIADVSGTIKARLVAFNGAIFQLYEFARIAFFLVIVATELLSNLIENIVAGIVRTVLEAILE